jgi:hypothetical protein
LRGRRRARASLQFVRSVIDGNGVHLVAVDGNDRVLGWCDIARLPLAGFERIELDVFASNVRARALYEQVGFVEEGVRRRACQLDGQYDDDVIMALLL